MTDLTALSLAIIPGPLGELNPSQLQRIRGYPKVRNWNCLVPPSPNTVVQDTSDTPWDFPFAWRDGIS